MILGEPVQMSTRTPPGPDSPLQGEKKIQTNVTTFTACANRLEGSAAQRNSKNRLNLRKGFKIFETFRFKDKVDSFI